MNKTQEKRLLNVARALRESSAPTLFDMGLYAYSGGGVLECGTPACAIGHYAARRDLQRQFRIDTACGYVEIKGVGPYEIGNNDHFGITYAEDVELFAPGGCGGAKTVKQAARYIERFVARKKKEQARK